MQSEHSYAKELMEDYPGLTQYEALSLAIGMKRNVILKSAFLVDNSESYPVALEAIAIALGYGSGNVRESLEGISNQIESLRDAIDEQFKIS